MKTTDIEISKQLAAALEKAGYDICPRYSFEFIHTGNKKYPVLSVETLEYMSQDSYIYELENPNPAFTMIELWDMLPNDINSFDKTLIHDRSGYVCNDYYDSFAVCVDNNPCNALALLALWCIENNHKLNLKKKEQ